MLKKIQIKGKIFWDYYKLACGFVFGLASACLLFFDRSDFKIESCCSKVLAIVILILLSFAFAIVKVLTNNKLECLKGKIIFRYGD